MSVACTIYDYLDDGGENDVQAFISSLEVRDRARLEAKIDTLRDNGFILLQSNLLTDTSNPHVKELRVNGQVAVRMLLCRGPVDGRKEATLLYGAFERDNRYVPGNALEIADIRRLSVAENPGQRRAIRE